MGHGSRCEVDHGGGIKPLAVLDAEAERVVVKRRRDPDASSEATTTSTHLDGSRVAVASVILGQG
jgi:hypothetical protein